MRSIPIVTAIIAIAILLHGSAVDLHAAPTKVIDQANAGPIAGTNGGSTFGQSFTPTLSGMDYIEFLMGGHGEIVTVSILDGISGYDGLGGGRSSAFQTQSLWTR